MKKELAKIVGMKDENQQMAAFREFLNKYANSLPLPGQNAAFDKAIWEASKFTQLSMADQSLLKQVTRKLLTRKAKATLKLQDLLSATKEAALTTWQETLNALSWQQLVPAGAMRGIGGQMVSLGSYERQLADLTIKLNLGWIVDQDQIRLLLQAQDKQQRAVPEVELRVKESTHGIVFSNKTNRDGSVVISGLTVNPGQYQIEVAWKNEIAQTPYFVI